MLEGIALEDAGPPQSDKTVVARKRAPAIRPRAEGNILVLLINKRG